MGKCPHWRNCKFFTITSHVCSFGGQDFCGIFKRWEERSKEWIGQTPIKNVMINSNCRDCTKFYDASHKWCRKFQEMKAEWEGCKEK